jgi:hypothetical protein
MDVSAAARKRRHRARAAAGRIILQVECSDALVAALLAAGVVSEAESRCRADLAKAVTECLDDWTRKVLG